MPFHALTSPPWTEGPRHRQRSCGAGASSRIRSYSVCEYCLSQTTNPFATSNFNRAPLIHYNIPKASPLNARECSARASRNRSRPGLPTLETSISPLKHYTKKPRRTASRTGRLPARQQGCTQGTACFVPSSARRATLGLARFGDASLWATETRAADCGRLAGFAEPF